MILIVSRGNCIVAALLVAGVKPQPSRVTSHLPRNFLFCFDSLRPGRHFFSHVGMGLPELNQY